MTRFRFGLAAILFGVLGAACAPSTTAHGYSREEFGPAWSDDVSVPGGHNGCDTRNDILARDLIAPHRRAGSRCVVVSGTLHDRYTGHTIAFTKAAASRVQIDHIVPLEYAWRHGAAGWPASLRRDFANDPRNLLAVDGRQNQAKGAHGPAEWMPPNRAEHCDYARRFATVADLYRITVTEQDRAALTRALGSCP